MKKRLLGILLSFALMLTMMPVLGLSQTAYAADTTATTAEEFLNAVNNGGSVSLGNDITLPLNVNLCFYHELTIDLNGHTLTVEKVNDGSSCRFVIYTAVTIKDSSSSGGGKLTNPTDGYVMLIWDDGSLALESGTLEFTHSDNYGIDVCRGPFTMTGGTINSNKYSIWREGEKVTISGGTIIGDFKSSYGDLSITGGKFSFDPSDLLVSPYTATKDGSYWVVGVPVTYEVTYKVVGGTWADDSTTDKKETVQSGSKPASVPTGMKASEGYTGGAWDTDPAEATITGATTFTYSFTAKPTPTPTPAANPLTVTTTAKPSARSMTVKWTWNNVPGAKSYKVSYHKVGSKKWTTKKTKKTKYVVKGHKMKGLYEYKVAAVTASGDVWSNTSCRYFKGVKTKAKAGKAAGTVRASWKKDKGATGYQVKLATNKKLNGAQVVNVSADKKAYTFSGLKSGKKYYVSVRPLKDHNGVTYQGIRCKALKVKAK